MDTLDPEPDHYYGSHENYFDGAPVFTPTLAEFQDFDLYVNAIDHKFGARFGIVKIVPPQAWIDALPDIKQRLATATVTKPIAQRFDGGKGIYRQANLEIKRNYSVADFAKHALYQHHRPPYLSSASAANTKALASNSSRSAAQRTTRASSRLSAIPVPIQSSGGDIGKDTTLADSSVLPASPYSNQAVPAIKIPISERPPTCFFASLPQPHTSTKPDPLQDPRNDTSDQPPPSKKKKLDAGRRYKFQSIDLNAEYLQFDGFEDDLYTVRFSCTYVRETLEREYWRSILSDTVPMYGADLQGSLWPSASNPGSWNTNKIDVILGHCLPARIPGVNVPYLYFGTWRATFGWHAEDADLYSINYLHFGAPKAWYAIPSSQAFKFEALALKLYPLDHKACSQFLRHKTFHFSPAVLEAEGITVHRMVQEKFEFVITFPRGYHAGFNLGFNCAESVNFALPRWFSFGKRAKKCQCVDHSVSVDAFYLESVYLHYKQMGVLPTAVPRRVKANTPPKRDLSSSDGLSELGESPRMTVAPPTQFSPPPTPGPLVRPRLPAIMTGSHVLNNPCVHQSCAACPITSAQLTSNLGALLPITPPVNPRTKMPTHVHSACAQCIPELEIVASGHAVSGMDHIYKERWTRACVVCGGVGPDVGIAVRCRVAGCMVCVHPGCAIVQQWVCPGDAGGIWCGKHTPQQTKTPTGSFHSNSSISNRPPPHAVPAYPLPIVPYRHALTPPLGYFDPRTGTQAVVPHPARIPRPESTIVSAEYPYGVSLWDVYRRNL